MSAGTVTVTIDSATHTTTPSIFCTLLSLNQKHVTSKQRNTKECTEFKESFTFDYDSDLHSDTSLTITLDSRSPIGRFHVESILQPVTTTLFDPASKSTVTFSISYATTEGFDLLHANYLLYLAYAVIFFVWFGCKFIPIPYYINLLLLTTALIYAGSHQSLSVLRLDSDSGSDSDSTDSASASTSSDLDQEVQVEVMGMSDAMKVPFIGSAVLFGLYTAFKYFGEEWVNYLLTSYFVGVGFFALNVSLAPLVSVFVGKKVMFEKKIELKNNFLGKLLFTDSEQLKCDIELTLGHFITGTCVAIFLYFYVVTKHWMLNNVLGISFVISGISQMSIGSYKTGLILLVGLFFYDVFWVFGTDVMVTVAKKLDGPIKILIPRSLVPNEAGKIPLTLLGLGDIVIPGFFVSILLRFDAHRAGAPMGAAGVHANFPKPFFHATLIGYFVGLATTFVFMIKFNSAQPALLYLVPAILVSSMGCAFARGEVKELMDYEEGEDIAVEEELEKKEN